MKVFEYSAMSHTDNPEMLEACRKANEKLLRLKEEALEEFVHFYDLSNEDVKERCYIDHAFGYPSKKTVHLDGRPMIEFELIFEDDKAIYRITKHYLR